MFTPGFRFKPWKNPRAIADGPSIMNYLNETVREYGLGDNIRYRHRVQGVEWSDADNRWTVRVEADGEQKDITCSFLFACSGYYNYDQGYSPEFPGARTSRGRSCIRSTGRRISTTPASGPSSSAVAPQR